MCKRSGQGDCGGRGRSRTSVLVRVSKTRGTVLVLLCWVASGGGPRGPLGARVAWARWRGPSIVIADRGLRGHRRHPDGGPGEPGRLDRLAVPAPLRLRGLLRGAAWRRGQWA